MSYRRIPLVSKAHSTHFQKEFTGTKMINSDSLILNTIPMLVVITHLKTKTCNLFRRDPSICLADSNPAATNFSNLSQIIFALSTALRLRNNSLRAFEIPLSGFLIYILKMPTWKGFFLLFLNVAWKHLKL